MKKFTRVLALLCVIAMTVLPLQVFAAAPSAYENEGRNLAVIANGDVNIYGDAMLIDGSVYSNGTIYVGDGQGNKINGIFISGEEGSLDPGDGVTEDWQCDGYIHVNDNGTRDNINAYSSKPEYNGAILDKDTSFECSYKPFSVPSIDNNLGDVLMTVYPNSTWAWSQERGSYPVVDESQAPRTITEDTYIENLTMNGSWVDAYNFAMVIDTTAGDVNVVINNMVSPVNPSFVVLGNNKANIYINNVSDISGYRINYNFNESWECVPIVGSANTNIYLTGDSVKVDASQISGNLFVNANSLEVSGSANVIGDIETNAKEFAIIGSQCSVTGTVCAPNAASRVVDSGTLYGQLHTDTLTINGSGRIIYKPDTLPVPSGDEPIVTPEPTPDVDEGEPAYIVRYVVATGEYTRGTMDTKMHKPARGVDKDGNKEEELEYEVLDETTYQITGPQYVSDEIKERVQLILNTTDDVFVQRGSEGLIQPSRFGRIDFNGQDMSLSITPYAYPRMKDKIDTMYLCWGDRNSQVETVWYVIPEELR